MVPQEEVELISHLPAFYQSILLTIYPYAGLPIDQARECIGFSTLSPTLSVHAHICQCTYVHDVNPSLSLSLSPHVQINMLMILIVQSIAGSVYRRLRSTIVRRAVGMALGFLVMFTMYGFKGSFGLLLYVVAMYYPIVHLKNPRISFWLSMGVLFCSFFYIAWFYYLSWRLDFTTSLMGITIRMHTV